MQFKNIFTKIFYSLNLAILSISQTSCTYKEYVTTDISENSEISESTDFSTEVETTNIKNENKSEKIGENIPITRGLVAKIISLTYGTKKEIEETKRVIPFEDTTPEQWYDKYINYAFSKNYINGTDNKFNPEDYLTVSQAQALCDKIDFTKKIQLNINEKTKDKPISYNLWCELYLKVLSNLSEKNTLYEKFGISKKRATILAVPENNKNIKEGFTVTDKGLLKCSGINLVPYIDKEISFYEKENEILFLSEITSENPILENTYVVENDTNCTIFTGGAEKTYKKSDTFTESENPDKNTIKLADIQLNDNKISKISYITEKSELQIKSLTDTKLTSVDEKTYEISPDVKIYFLQNNKVMYGTKEDIIEGKTYEVYFKDNKICGFVFFKY